MISPIWLAGGDRVPARFTRGHHFCSWETAEAYDSFWRIRASCVVVVNTHIGTTSRAVRHVSELGNHQTRKDYAVQLRCESESQGIAAVAQILKQRILSKR